MKKTRNKFEQKIDLQLRKAKVKYEYETKKVSYILSKYYIPDFILYTSSGLIYVECKGYLRPEHKEKMAAVKRQHPELDIRILFYSENKKYIKWANKVGYRFAIGTIPEEWLNGL